MKTSQERAREIAEKHAHHGHSKGSLCEDCSLMADDIAAAIDEAVGEEREICARIADAYDVAYGSGAAAVVCVADDIRARGKVG